MHFQDFFPSFQIRKLYGDPPVKPARTQKRGIKAVRTVSSRQDNDSLRRVKSIHLCQKLIQGLLTFIIS